MGGRAPPPALRPLPRVERAAATWRPSGTSAFITMGDVGQFTRIQFSPMLFILMGITGWEDQVLTCRVLLVASPW